MSQNRLTHIVSIALDDDTDLAIPTRGIMCSADATLVVKSEGQTPDDIVIAADGGTGYDFNDATPDTIDRNDGGDWIADGIIVGGTLIVSDAGEAGNDGIYDVTVVTAGTLTVAAVGGADAALVADTLDTAANFVFMHTATLLCLAKTFYPYCLNRVHTTGTDLNSGTLQGFY